jgi:NAD(P)-dependent dehydrogenase (short-subunit alcohol dehydrogenase family)
LTVPSSGDRVALVTGANRGIGLEVVRQLLGYGFRTILSARDEAKGRTAAQEVGSAFVSLDVSDDESVRTCFEELDRTYGRLDVLVNNAAINFDPRKRANDVDLASVRETYETNVFGAWRTCQAAIPWMRRDGWGRIVNVSSEAGSLASMEGRAPAYATSKTALNALTKILAAELRGTGILVNAVSPGWIATDMGGPGGAPIDIGAARVVWAALLPDDGPTGGFFRDGRPVPW